MIKKFLLIACLFISHFCCAHQERELTHEECKGLVKNALVCAYLDQRYNFGDGTFPKQESIVEFPGNIPTSFTTQHAQACGRGPFGQDITLEDELSVQVIHKQEASGRGAIKVRVIRAHYDQAKRDYEQYSKIETQKCSSFRDLKCSVLQYFEFFELDRQ